MSKDKVEKITLYVENNGRGKVTIVDSKISIQDFPAFTKEGKKAIGVYATPVDVMENGLKGFVGMVKVRHPHQLNILSAEEYEATRKKALSLAKAKAKEPEEPETTIIQDPTQDELMEKEFYDAAMTGEGKEIDDYMSAYPEGKYNNDVIERSVFLTAKANNTKKSLNDYLKKYPQGKYVQEVNTLLAS